MVVNGVWFAIVCEWPNDTSTDEVGEAIVGRADVQADVRGGQLLYMVEPGQEWERRCEASNMIPRAVSVWLDEGDIAALSWKGEEIFPA